MLTAVPTAVNDATRQVVLRHPNSQDCTVWRKVVTRVEPDPQSGDPSEMGGSPTLGGMGVMRSEDESDFDYVEQGAARCLFCGLYEPSEMNEREDAAIQANAQTAKIEPTAGPGQDGYFELQVTDLVLITPGLDVVLAFEVAAFTAKSNIPPYVSMPVLNPRDDLHNLEPFTG